MIEKRVQGLKTPAIPPPCPNTSAEEWEHVHYKRIKANGRFLHSRSFYVGPRSAPSTHATGAGLMTPANPQTGFFVVTPFVPANAECDPLLINRGWIPSTMKKQMQGAPDATQTQSIICVPRLGERQSMFVTNDAVNGNWLSLNIAEMAPNTGLERVAPVICELLGERAPAQTMRARTSYVSSRRGGGRGCLGQVPHQERPGAPVHVPRDALHAPRLLCHVVLPLRRRRRRHLPALPLTGRPRPAGPAVTPASSAPVVCHVCSMVARATRPTMGVSQGEARLGHGGAGRAARDASHALLGARRGRAAA